MKLQKLIRFCLILALSLGIFAIVQGQGVLNYGDTISNSLSADAPQAFFSFTGATGDVVTVYALGWESTFQPTLSLLSSNGQPLAFSSEDTLSPAANDSRINYRLPSDGSYSIFLSSEGGVAGNYTLALRLADRLPVNPLEGRTNILIEPNGAAQNFAVPANTEIPTTLSIQSRRPNQGFRAQLIDPNGQILAVITGGLEGATLVIPSGTGIYEVLIEAVEPNLGAEVELAIFGGSAPLPATTEESAAPADPNACVITANNANVRSGPGTNYGIVGALNSANQMIATGQNSGWYTGTVSGVIGWVAADVVTASGNCGNLPLVQAPPTPIAPVATENTQATATASPTATATNQNNQNNQATPTPTASPTESAQVAPPDSDLVVSYNIKSNSGSQISEFISFPNGDTSDGIFYNITGFDSVTTSAEVRFTLFCNGDTANVQVRSGNQVLGGCNDSFTRLTGTDNDTVRFIIEYLGGDNVFLNWTMRAETVSCAPRAC